jgi:spore germination protein YaaH
MPRLASPEIFGYLPYWDLNAQIDYGAITTIAYFGLGAGADGHIIKRDNSGLTTEYSRWQSTKVSDTIAAAHAHGDRFVLTVEGMAWDTNGATTVRALLGNPAARATLVADIIAEIKARGLDGVSLDFEPILSDQRDNFASLLHELRTALDAVNPEYQLTLAATGSQLAQTMTMFSQVTKAGAADAVIIMAYPLRAIDAAYAGGLSPLVSPLVFDLKQITGSYLKYVSPSDLVMALPWYGREWPTVSSAVNSPVQTNRSLYGRPHNIDYADALQLAAQYGRQLDTGEMSAYTTFRSTAGPGCPQTWMQVYYDDVDTLRAKLDYVSSSGLAGVGIFALGYDNTQPELWKLLRVKYRGLVDNTAPTGQVSLAPGTTVCRATSAATLTLSASDGTAGSGAVFVRLSNQATTNADGTLSIGRTYPATAQVAWRLDDPSVGGSTTLGTRTVYAQWRDVVGHWSVPTSTSFSVLGPASATFKVAGGAQYTINPTVPVVVNQTAGRAITKVLVSNSSAMSSGMLSHSMTITPGVATSFSLINTTYGGSDVDGTRNVYAQWQDSAGCWSDPVAANVVLDRAAPTGTLTIANGASTSTDGNVQLLAPATDRTSGVASLELSNDGLTWTSLAPTNVAFTWTAGAMPDGTWTVRARWRDKAGNVSAPKSVSLALDRANLAGSISVNGGAHFTDSATVNVVAVPPGTATKLLLANDPTTTNGVLAGATQFAPNASVSWPLSQTLATLADGPHVVYAQWQDSAGAWSSVTSATITLDRTPPLVAVPYPALVAGTNLGPTAVPVDFVGKTADTGSGVVNSSAQYASKAGTWMTLGQDLVTSAVDFQIDRSSMWQLKSTAIDAAGNTSTAVSVPFRANVTEDVSSAIHFTTAWTAASMTSSSSGNTHYTTRRGQMARFSFVGSSIGWVASVGPNSGRARVYVDGTYVGCVDLGRATQARVLVFTKTWATAGQHRIKITTLGTPGRPRVDVDAFIVLG